MKDKILIFLKGVLMGICDLIPGISGGTIAFITGIYMRLINAVKSFSLKILYDIFMWPLERRNRKRARAKKIKQGIKKLDLGFLLILLFGIFSALLLGSRVIKFFLTNYFAYTISFFIGLIIASSKTLYDDIEECNKGNMLFGFFGFIIGILLLKLVPVIAPSNLYYVFFGGFIGISAMFLPGISGAFILLIMGLYEPAIDVLQNIPGNMPWFLTFAAGVLLGAFTISRIISFLFKKAKCKVLYLLLGLVIGALSIPIKKIFETASFEILNIFLMLFFLLLGALIVVVITGYKKRIEK